MPGNGPNMIAEHTVSTELFQDCCFDLSLANHVNVKMFTDRLTCCQKL